jgi:glutathione peroxidase-family protein
MLKNCKFFCDSTTKQSLQDDQDLQGMSDSFFDLSAQDIHGQTVEFQQFKGDVVIVTNVASECGYTDSHYRGLVELYGHFTPKASADADSTTPSRRVHILAFPCNQFGKQEPGSSNEIQQFAEGYGVQFQMMKKLNVNGRYTDIVYKFLKKKGKGPLTIEWNFATYFVVAPDGTVTSHSGVEPMDLKQLAFRLLSAAPRQVEEL